MDVHAVRGRFTTVPALFGAVAERYPDREAFVDGTNRLTFGQWFTAAGGVASLLAGVGVGKGDVVCLLLPPSADYAICYQAAMALGALTSGINLRLGPAEIASIVERTRPRAIICDDNERPPPGPAVALSRAAVGEASTWAPPAHRPRLEPEDPVAVVWTSGTTGRPKGAVFDHGNLAAMAAGAGVLSVPGDRRLSPLPFAHVGYMTRPWDELANVITTVIVPSPWRAAEALRLLDEEHITVGQGVPAQWRLMLDHPRSERTDFSALRIAALGGSTVPPVLVREMRERLRCPVVVRYTSTEASLTTGTSVDDPDEAVAYTVGRAADGVEVRIVADAGTSVADGEVGTVSCRSGAVMRRYWDDPEGTAQVLSADGWLTTGDVGYFDAAGRLVLVGRKADMFIRGGYNVYPAEVEAVLGTHPLVGRVAVIGAPDPVLGELGVAVVAPAEAGGPVPTLEELREWCRRKLADYKAPDRLLAVDELPLTPMLKVDRQALAAEIAEALASPR